MSGADGPRLVCGPLCRVFDDPAVDAAQRARAVERWRDEINGSLEARFADPLSWIEDPAQEPIADSLDTRAWDGLRLLAVYADRPEAELPDAMPRPLPLDTHWCAAEGSRFERSRYGHLLAARAWLPGDFEFTFRCPGPHGDELTFGSLAVLADQVRWLNERTLHADRAHLTEWQNAVLDDDAAFVDCARNGLAIIVAAVERARELSLPLAVC